MKDAKKRKEIPLFRGLAMYFPNALRAISHLSLVGNQQHHKDKPLHWDRAKSTDEPDALMRHLFDCGPNWDNKDEDGEYHATKVAWRSLAMLEKVLEKK